MDQGNNSGKRPKRDPSISEVILFAHLEAIMSEAANLKEAVSTFSFGFLVKKVREALKMSVASLARRSDLRQSVVESIEKGEMKHLGKVPQLLKALDCELVSAPLLKRSCEDILQEQAEKQAQEALWVYTQSEHWPQTEEEQKRIYDIALEYFLSSSGDTLWESGAAWAFVRDLEPIKNSEK